MMMQRAAIILVIGLLGAGCAGDGVDDLREFTDSTHKNTKPRVEPIPEVKVSERFAYSAYDLPDPFGPDNLAPAASAAAQADDDSGPRPDETRPKDPLEEYPLDALQMVGTLERDKKRYALVKVTVGVGEMYRVKVGDHVGKNYGMITRISEDQVVLVELVKSALGKWVEREATLQIKQ
jgi:type IV pilus assembly protein PilP